MQRIYIPIEPEANVIPWIKYLSNSCLKIRVQLLCFFPVDEIVLPVRVNSCN